MSPEARKAVVQAYYDRVVNRGEFDAVDELFAEDFVNHDVGASGRNDREGIKAMFRMMRAAFPDLHFALDLLLCDGEYVFNLGTATGTHQGAFRGMPGTGRRVEFKEMHVYRVRAGRITDRWWVADRLGLYQQLGLV